MYFFGRDTLGRTFYNAVDRFMLHEILDQGEIHILQIETSSATQTGWVMLFNGTHDSVTQKFDEIVAAAQATAQQHQIPVIDFYEGG